MSVESSGHVISDGHPASRLGSFGGVVPDGTPVPLTTYKGLKAIHHPDTGHEGATALPPDTFMDYDPTSADPMLRYPGRLFNSQIPYRHSHLGGNPTRRSTAAAFNAHVGPGFLYKQVYDLARDTEIKEKLGEGPRAEAARQRARSEAPVLWEDMTGAVAVFRHEVRATKEGKRHEAYELVGFTSNCLPHGSELAVFYGVNQHNPNNIVLRYGMPETMLEVVEEQMIANNPKFDVQKLAASLLTDFIKAQSAAKRSDRSRILHDHLTSLGAYFPVIDSEKVNPLVRSLREVQRRGWDKGRSGNRSRAEDLIIRGYLKARVMQLQLMGVPYNEPFPDSHQEISWHLLGQIGVADLQDKTSRLTQLIDREVKDGTQRRHYDGALYFSQTPLSMKQIGLIRQGIPGTWQVEPIAKNGLFIRPTNQFIPHTPFTHYKEVTDQLMHKRLPPSGKPIKLPGCTIFYIPLGDDAYEELLVVDLMQAPGRGMEWLLSSGFNPDTFIHRYHAPVEKQIFAEDIFTGRANPNTIFTTLLAYVQRARGNEYGGLTVKNFHTPAKPLVVSVNPQSKDAKPVVHATKMELTRSEKRGERQRAIAARTGSTALANVARGAEHEMAKRTIIADILPGEEPVLTATISPLSGVVYVEQHETDDPEHPIPTPQVVVAASLSTQASTKPPANAIQRRALERQRNKRNSRRRGR